MEKKKALVKKNKKEQERIKKLLEQAPKKEDILDYYFEIELGGGKNEVFKQKTKKHHN